MSIIKLNNVANYHKNIPLSTPNQKGPKLMDLSLLDCYAKYIKENLCFERSLVRLFYFAVHFVIPSNHRAEPFVSHALAAPWSAGLFSKIPTIFQKMTYIKILMVFLSISGWTFCGILIPLTIHRVWRPAKEHQNVDCFTHILFLFLFFC